MAERDFPSFLFVVKKYKLKMTAGAGHFPNFNNFSRYRAKKIAPTLTTISYADYISYPDYSNYSLHFFSTRALFVPPNPKEFDRSRSIFFSTVLSAMLSFWECSSGVSKLMLGATNERCIMSVE